MQYQILLFIISFIIYCNNFVNSKALIGRNVETVRDNGYLYVVPIVGVNPAIPIEQDIFCTGTLISRIHIVTSEHCFDSVTNVYPFRIIVGSSNIIQGVSYYPLWFSTYDQWATYHNIEIISENDIAVISTFYHMPAELGKAYIPTSSVYNHIIGTTLQMVGWGRSNSGEFSGKLEIVNSTVLSNPECTFSVSRVLDEWFVISTRYLCSKSIPYALLRNGDSGGPLLLQNILIAVNKATCPKLNIEIFRDLVNIHTRLDIYLNFFSGVMAHI